MMVRLYEIGEESAGNVEIGFLSYQTYSKYDQNRIYGDRIWPKAGFLGCYNVCERMKDTKGGYFIV